MAFVSGNSDMTDYYKDDEPYTPRPKYTHRFTAIEVRALREERGCGMAEAKQILMRQQILEDLKRGRNSQDVVLLYNILEYMIENHYV